MRVRVAGFWRRLAGGIVDGMVLSSVFAIVATLAAVVLRQPLPRIGQIGPDYVVDMAVNGGVLAEAGLAMIAILSFLYFFLFTALRGQTFGKHLMRLKVIDGFGDRPSITRALVRTIAYVPSLVLLGLGFLWIGFDREKRGLHDWLADTYVVKA
ncbi:MAG: domain containing protein [Myxococcales bacterium]|nr:domain containing protein [Myxococcales bacterium]